MQTGHLLVCTIALNEKNEEIHHRFHVQSTPRNYNKQQPLMSHRLVQWAPPAKTIFTLEATRPT